MKNVGYSLIIFVITILLFEGLFRIFLHFNDPDPHQIKDDRLGWKIKEYTNIIINKNGIKDIRFTTSKNGFRIWGDINSKKKKVLFVGDSYTEGLQVDDGKCYYNYIDTTLYEIFAFGCSGYGTLQEYMAVDSLIDIISPNLMIWQFCPNDLTNNSLNLERQSNINNYLMKKPYLINDSIIYTTPHKSKFLSWIESYSKIALWSHLKILNIKSKYYGSIEEHFDMKMKIFNDSYHVTKTIYNKIKNKEIMTFVFSTTTSYGYKEIESICDELSIPFIESIHKNIDMATENGIVTTFQPVDWHWNETGHKIAGETLNKELKIIYNNF